MITNLMMKAYNTESKIETDALISHTLHRARLFGALFITAGMVYFTGMVLFYTWFAPCIGRTEHSRLGAECVPCAGMRQVWLLGYAFI